MEVENNTVLMLMTRMMQKALIQEGFNISKCGET